MNLAEVSSGCRLRGNCTANHDSQERSVLGLISARTKSSASELAYYFLLALFPLLLFLTSVIGLLIGSGTGLRQSLFNYLGKVLPSSASQLVSDTMF
jgi:uncharacterized BrkB/YihY/UPF0761 family membrane protein